MKVSLTELHSSIASNLFGAAVGVSAMTTLIELEELNETLNLAKRIRSLRNELSSDISSLKTDLMNL